MLSIPDMALLGAAALMFFGPEQLPKVARKVGLLVREVQNTSQSFIREMERAADEPAYEQRYEPPVQAPPDAEPAPAEPAAKPAAAQPAAADLDLPP
jgi:sec-independent protein translocase protein TatA